MKIGYKPKFLGSGFEVPLPRLTPAIEASVLRQSAMRKYIYLDYPHYTVVMNKTTRQPVFTALNIDQDLFKKTKSKGYWRADSRAGRENQLNNDYYRKNDWDKGHMVMRWNTAWGNNDYEAQVADDESYYYTNAAFQHMNLNRDEWLELEIDVVRNFSEDANNKLCVFTGPIHGDLDRHYERSWHDSVRIPSGFFKIICYIPKGNTNNSEVGVKAFILYQDKEIIKDKNGRSKILFANYQETVRRIEELTGLDFGQKLFNANPMMYFDTAKRRKDYNINIFPESRLITTGVDIIDGEIRPYVMEHREKRNVAIITAMVDPDGHERNGEYITLLNRSSKTIELTGWKLADEKNVSLSLGGKLLPGVSKTIKGNDLGAIRLRNNGGTLKLFDSDPCLIDHVTWSKQEVSKSKGRAIIFK